MKRKNHYFVFRDRDELVKLKIRKHLHKDTIIDVTFSIEYKIASDSKGWKVYLPAYTGYIIVIDDEKTEEIIKRLYRELRQYYENIKKLEREYYDKAIEIGKKIATEIGIKLNFFSDLY